MSQLLFATRNRGKQAEVEAILLPHGVDVLSLDDMSAMADVDEDQPTFAGNAEKKARAALASTGLPALADDSGLEVDALGGAPGVLSARYAGGHGDDAANIAKLLDAMKDVPLRDRTARFRCALAFLDEAGRLYLTDGTLEGGIAFAPRGSFGFGYDPIFLLPDGRTLAEVGPDEKNLISHRARALAAMTPHLLERLTSGG